jgi:hypothetical protein
MEYYVFLKFAKRLGLSKYRLFFIFIFKGIIVLFGVPNNCLTAVAGRSDWSLFSHRRVKAGERPESVVRVLRCSNQGV